MVPIQAAIHTVVAGIITGVVTPTTVGAVATTIPTTRERTTDLPTPRHRLIQLHLGRQLRQLTITHSTLSITLGVLTPMQPTAAIRITWHIISTMLNSRLSSRVKHCLPHLAVRAHRRRHHHQPLEALLYRRLQVDLAMELCPLHQVYEWTGVFESPRHHWPSHVALRNDLAKRLALCVLKSVKD